MKGNRFSEEQIIGILREHDAGAKTTDLCGVTGSRMRLSTSMDGSPVTRRFGSCLTIFDCKHLSGVASCAPQNYSGSGQRTTHCEGFCVR